MARRATIQDLAEKAGVSVSTVDRILNGRDPVRRTTAERVLAAAEKIDFYAVPLLRERLDLAQPRIRLGFLLQQSHRPWYQNIASALRVAAEAAEGVEVQIEHMDDLSPETVAARMTDMGARVGALAVVAAEHPRVAEAIETLSARGVPTFGLVSSLTATCGTGYIGLDNWKVGRTAAWAIARLCPKPGRIGILVGNPRYRCQEMNESGFRSYFRECAPDFTLLEPISTFEDKAIAREVTETLLRREPDLSALFISGGGVTGTLEAIAASGRGRQLVSVGYEIMAPTRAALIDGALTMVIAHPVQRMAAEAVGAMRDAVLGRTAPGQRLLSFDIFTPENV